MLVSKQNVSDIYLSGGIVIGGSLLDSLLKFTT